MKLLYDELEEFFAEHDLYWTIDGKYQNPTAEDIRQVVDKAIAALYDETSGILETGHLIVRKTYEPETDSTHHDLYLHFGEIK